MKKFLIALIITAGLIAPAAAADLDKFLGEWVAEKGPFLVVTAAETGEPQLAMPANEYWRAEFQNVRVEDGRLKFEQLNFLKDGRPHPYNGVVNYVEVWEDEAGEMHYTASTDKVAAVTGSITRKDSPPSAAPDPAAP